MHHLLACYGPYEPNAVWTYVVTNLLASVLTCSLTCLLTYLLAYLLTYLLTYLLKAFMDREAGQHASNMHVKRASACAPAADGGPSPSF